MTAFGQAWRTELAHLSACRWDLGMITLMPAILMILMAGMLWPGVQRGLPVAVVDNDHSTASRAVLRAIDASPTVDVVTVPDRPTALRLVRQERAWAIVALPYGLGTGAARQRPRKIELSYQASFLSTGAVVERAVSAAIQATLPGIGSDVLVSHALPTQGLALPPVQLTLLFNSPNSFEWYLLTLIAPAVLHLLVACVTAEALGREAEHGALGEWVRASGGVCGALAGKMAPYVLAAGGWGVAWLLYLTLLRGWRIDGSTALIAVAQVLLFAATAAISALILAISGRTAPVLSVSAVYAGSALAYSGATLPLYGASAFARIWSAILPLTHYMALQMDQFIGAPFRVALPDLCWLLLYVIVAGGGAVLLLARKARA